MSFVPEDSFNVAIALTGEGLVVTDISLSKTNVALGEAFEGTIYLSNGTGSPQTKYLAFFFGVLDPGTGEFTIHFGYRTVGAASIPTGSSAFTLVNMIADEVGIWDVLGCYGHLEDSVFYIEGSFGYLDMLTVT